MENNNIGDNNQSSGNLPLPNQPELQQPPYAAALLKKPKKKMPLLAKIGIIIAAVLLLLASTVLIFGRDIALLVVGTKSYYNYIEQSGNNIQLSSISENLTKTQQIYNSYELTANTSAANIDSLFGTSTSTQYTQISEIIKNSQFTLKFGRNVAKKIIGASLDWQFKGSKLITASGYVSSERLLVSSPELANKSVYIAPADAPDFKAIYDLAGKISTQTDESIKSSELQTFFKDIQKTYNDAITNKNITVARNLSSIIGGNKYTCDKITVKFSQEEFKALLHKMLTIAQKDNAINKLMNRYTNNDDILGSFISSLSGMNLVDTSLVSSTKVSFDSLSKLIDGFQTGSVSMSVLVKNDLISSEVLSREIKTESGYAFSNYFQSGKGEAVVTYPKSTDKSITEVKVAYTNTSETFTATTSVPDDNKNMVDIKLSVDKKVKTDFGVYAAKLTVGTTVQNKKAEYTLQTSSDAGKTKLEIAAKYDGKDTLMQTITVSASKDDYVIPDFDATKSVNFYKDSNPLLDVYTQVMTNLQGVFSKLGLK